MADRWTGRVPTHLPIFRLHSSAEVPFPDSLGTKSIGYERRSEVREGPCTE